MKDLNEYAEKPELFIPELREYWDSDEGGNNHGDQSTVHSVFRAFSGLVISKLETGTWKTGDASLTISSRWSGPAGIPRMRPAPVFSKVY